MPKRSETHYGGDTSPTEDSLFFKHKILRYQICQLVTVVGFAWKLEGVIKVWDKSGSRKFKRTF